MSAPRTVCKISGCEGHSRENLVPHGAEGGRLESSRLATPPSYHRHDSQEHESSPHPELRPDVATTTFLENRFVRIGRIVVDDHTLAFSVSVLWREIRIHMVRRIQPGARVAFSFQTVLVMHPLRRLFEKDEVGVFTLFRMLDFAFHTRPSRTRCTEMQSQRCCGEKDYRCKYRPD